MHNISTVCEVRMALIKCNNTNKFGHLQLSLFLQVFILGHSGSLFLYFRLFNVFLMQLIGSKKLLRIAYEPQISDVEAITLPTAPHHCPLECLRQSSISVSFSRSKIQLGITKYKKSCLVN